MSIFIIKAGIHDTIQDLGRNGHGMQGINAGGAMDIYAARMASILTGSNINDGVLEIHYPGPQILFEQDALISITGADFCPTLNNEALSCWQPILVRKNTILQFSGHRQGARCYLAVQGGFCMDKWLDSYSTNLKASVGGWKGRKLEKGDQLFFRSAQCYSKEWFSSDNNFKLLPWRSNGGARYKAVNEICVIAGNEWNDLALDSKEAFETQSFIIHPASDRMGYMLKANPLFVDNRRELISSAVSFGTIQLLPNGQLVILMADHQTTGGYPRIAHVVSAHLPKLAQLTPAAAIQFNLVDMDAAEQLLFAQERELQILHRACNDRLKELIC